MSNALQAQEALTFDDVLLVPAYSETLPREADTRTQFTPRISLTIPVVSAAMDTVTESRMAIMLARLGGIGVLHRNLSVDDQVAEVDRVKRSQAGMITSPIHLAPDATVGDARAMMSRYHVSGLPVTEPDGRLVGIITNRDIRFEERDERPVAEVMTREGLIVGRLGTSMEEAREIFRRHRIEKLPIVAEDGKLCGLITVKDLGKAEQYPEATRDHLGRLRVAAAVGVGPEALTRAAALVDAGVDAIVVDTAHGHGEAVIRTVRSLSDQIPIEIIAGNVVTADGARALLDAGAATIKVGVGPGSICTTRLVAGVGMPQMTAVAECAAVARECGATLISDGGIRYSGDIAKALAAGADSVMLGSLLAGVDESPGEVIFERGEGFKEYRGMGSLRAMMGRGYSRDRYRQEHVSDVSKLVPEGVEARVPYRGALQSLVNQLVGGLRASMGYLGAADVQSLRGARMVRVTSAGQREGQPHSVELEDSSAELSRF
ncbi:MAG TPA: IMP dehydrogenase [Steroidobacteraceae bacterium]|nr:IMP dehydrogenase [Steroidobacteraceae bacterium]